MAASREGGDREVDKTSNEVQPQFLQPVSITFKDGVRPPIANDPGFGILFTGDSDVPFEQGRSARNCEDV